MKKVSAISVLLLCGSIAFGQDLVIINARIIDGTGTTIDKGSVVIVDGRIDSISNNTPNDVGATRVDASGMTVMPGFIDTHAHVLGFSRATSAENLQEWMNSYLDKVLFNMLQAGVTTFMNPGDYLAPILEVREKLAHGELIGPRMLVAGPVLTAPDSHPAVTVCRGNPFCRATSVIEVDDPDIARAEVRRLSAAGVDFIKAVYHTGKRMPDLADDVVGAIAGEAEKCGIPFVVHDPYFSGILKGAALGVDGFVHTPWRDIGDIDIARMHLADAGIPVTTTVSIHDSFVDAEGIRRTVMGNRFPPSQDDHRPNSIANLGVLWKAGVSLAFGTDTQPMRPYREAVLGEVMAIAEVLPNEAVIEILTRNAAKFLNRSDDIGTLESGKIADIVIIDGDPLADISALANIKVVIQGGRIVVDNR